MGYAILLMLRDEYKSATQLQQLVMSKVDKIESDAIRAHVFYLNMVLLVF